MRFTPPNALFLFDFETKGNSHRVYHQIGRSWQMFTSALIYSIFVFLYFLLFNQYGSADINHFHMCKEVG